MMVDEIDITELVEAVERVKAIYRKPLLHPVGRRGNPTPNDNDGSWPTGRDSQDKLR